ncbi:hypothetical protein L6452_41474 [Arctium lappa]|uniref:Uncharacterized protein n=1 Tax=Arctium lappa TaxID=4217 RepID=A0ACB8XP21_ARCLA|nr:hypothetical protein L6452_41474 [Arctium lappa]
MSTQKLLEDEVIDRNGIPLKNQMIQLSTTMPFMDPAKFTWACIGDQATNKIIFDIVVLDAKEAAETADWIICNSTMELEAGAFTLFPKMLPIGPLLASNCFLKQTSHFWKEDSTCLTWLDQQPVCSVIYVAPGTSGSTNTTVYPDGFMDRVRNRGKMFLNKTYICEIWKTGLGLNKDENSGIVTRGEIKSKVEQLLSNNIVKENALNLQEKVGAGKSSNKNLGNFIDWLKEGNVNAPEENTCN